MHFALLRFPSMDPVAFWLGPLPIRWYGLAYAAGLLAGWQYVKRLVATSRFWPGATAPFSAEKVDDLLLYMVAGVVVGGRLGDVLLWDTSRFAEHPIEILQVWRGGMSFHGGFIGCVLAIALFCRLHRAPLLTVFDLASAATPIGLFLGRIANFINGELWGKPSTVPWAMIFPAPDAGGVPRHPSQLYEAGLEGIVLFLLCWWLVYRRGALKKPGLVAGVFTAGYGLARIVSEHFREPDVSSVVSSTLVSTGTLYSLPMVAVGIAMIVAAEWHTRRAAA